MRLPMGKSNLIRWAFILLAVHPPGLVAQAPNWQEIRSHYQRGKDAMQAKQNDVAAKEFREILRLDPRNAEAHANLGVIAYTSKEYSQALEQFRAALQLRPSLWNAEAFLGLSELRLGRLQDAQPHLEESFRHVQDAHLQSQVGMDLISVYFQTGRLNQAVDVLRILQRAHPEEPALLYTAYRTYMELASGTLSKLVEVAPESAEMHRILAQAQMSQDDYAGAIAQYRKALEVNPGLPGLHFELGQAILSSSTDEPARQEAEKEFRLALAENPADANSHYMLGEIEWLRNRPEKALEHDVEAIRLQPRFVDAQIALGKALTILGRPEEALEHLAEALRLEPENEVAHYRSAQAYRKLGRTEDAEHELAIFRKLRDSHQPVRDLFQQVEERSVPHQTVGPSEPQ